MTKARVHVVPTSDAIDHDTEHRCVCGPSADTGLDGDKILTHHPLTPGPNQTWEVTHDGTPAH